MSDTKGWPTKYKPKPVKRPAVECAWMASDCRLSLEDWNRNCVQNVCPDCAFAYQREDDLLGPLDFFDYV